jgi:hypothetical protein
MKSELISKYKDIQTQIEALQAQAKIFAKEIVHKSTAEYFGRYGHIIEAISWTQYTPYFNDGESCEFRVQEACAFFHPLLDSEDEENEFSEDSKNLFVAEEFTVESVKARMEIMQAYEADPVAWSKQAVAVKNAAVKHRSYTYSDDYYVTYPPENYSVEELIRLRYMIETTPAGFVEDTQALLSVINSIDEQAMRELFGDHTRVIITRNGVTCEDYHHD